jgi:oligopeptide/dipeptide ABC transporter ATP-binding protein
VQAQILDLLGQLQSEMDMSVMLITHDLGVIAETCDEVVVMYAGRVVESAPVEELFGNPLHAYTKALLRSIPTLDTPPKSVLPTIPGTVAALADYTHGCRFCQRLGKKTVITRERPEFKEVQPGHRLEICKECSDL